MESLIEVSTEANQNPNIDRRKESHSGNKSNIVIIGDSMIKNNDPRKLSRKRFNKFSFPGKRAEELHPKSGIKIDNNQPMLMHEGTNNVPKDTGDQCIKNIKGLCSRVKEKFPQSKLGVSGIFLRKDIDSHFYSYLQQSDILTNSQYGFRLLHSTVTALLKMSDQWYRNMDEGLINGVVFLDLKKSF